MNNEYNCKYCANCGLGFIRGEHNEQAHLEITVDLSDLPIDIVKALRFHFVREQQFEDASKCREMEKIIVKSNELTQTK